MYVGADQLVNWSTVGTFDVPFMSSMMFNLVHGSLSNKGLLGSTGEVGLVSASWTSMVDLSSTGFPLLTSGIVRIFLIPLGCFGLRRLKFLILNSSF